MVGIPTRKANSVAAGRSVRPASMPAKMVQPEREAPGNEHQRQDRARLDRDVEQLRAFTQPLLGDEQMPGARDRQELGDAFEDAEDDGAEGVGHLNLLTSDIELHAAHFDAEDCSSY